MVNFGPLRAEIGWWFWSTPVNFNRFRILATLLHPRRSTEVNQTLQDVSPSPGLVHYIYIFGGSCPLTEFCHVKNSLYVETLHSPILAVLLHSTRAVSVSQTLHRGIFTRQGGHPVRHWEVELFSFVFFILTTGHMHLTASFCRYAVILCNIAVNYVCIAIESARCVCTKTILFIIFVCHWWLGIRKSIRHDPACKKIEWWGAGVVICLEQGSYGWNMVQLMPMPLRCVLLH